MSFHQSATTKNLFCQKAGGSSFSGCQCYFPHLLAWVASWYCRNWWCTDLVKSVLAWTIFYIPGLWGCKSRFHYQAHPQIGFVMNWLLSQRSPLPRARCSISSISNEMFNLDSLQKWSPPCLQSQMWRMMSKIIAIIEGIASWCIPEAFSVLFGRG